MFEIEEKSNLAPLLMAVLVGLLALASPYYSRLDIKAIEGLFQREEPVQTVEVARVLRKTAADLLSELPAIDQAMSSQYGLWKSRQIPTDNPKTVETLEKLIPFAERLEELQQEAQTEQLVSLLRSFFMAADLNEKQFSSSFDALCEALTGDPDERVRSQAGVLQYYRKNDLDRPNPAKLLPALDRFSLDYHDPRSGIQLYSIVSHSLWSHGHLNASIDVLKTGMKRFSGQPGVSRLVNQMVDQQQPPALRR